MTTRPTTGHLARRTSAVHRRRSRLRTCLIGLSAAIAAAATTLVWSPPASAASTRLGIAPALHRGDPTVTYHLTGYRVSTRDRAWVCFGDEAPTRCDSIHPGTAVSVAALTRREGMTVSHTYAAESRFRATLFVARTLRSRAYASATATVGVTIDGTARFRPRTKDLTVSLDGRASTAASGDTWWACFGDVLRCDANHSQAHGTVSPGSPPLSGVSHTYARPGRYAVSLTVNGRATVGTATRLVAVSAPDPTAALTADGTSGTGSLPVIFGGSTSTAGPGDTWAFCYGDTPNCSQANPDVSGQISSTTPTVALPTSPHTYLPGSYTATLWVANGGTTSTATLAITVGNPVAAPDGTCTLSAITRSCDLFAKGNGSVTVDGRTIPFWGFTTSDAATPVLGGPTLIATEGEKLHLTVHNELDPRAGNVAVTLPAVAASPDLTGIAPGATGDAGTFTLSRPGTYVYEAGLTPGGARQVAMGMSGVLIVRPSVRTSANSLKCAYDAAVSTTDCVANHDALNYFDREKLVVVNELDADFNGDPFGSDTADYHPTAFFVDGVAYDPAKPALDPSDAAFSAVSNAVRLDAAPGDNVLVRYADLGLREHAMTLENLLQTEVARDSQHLLATSVQNTEFLNAGQTADAFVTIPADAVTGTRYPLLDGGYHLNNGASGGIGGMYTYLDVVNGATAADRGPVGSAATADPVFSATAPNIDNGQVPALDVSAAFTAQKTAGGSVPTVNSVQWALDGVPGAGGLWHASGATPSPADSATASVTFTISPADLSALLGTEPDRVFGSHTLWLQAVDSNGKPGPAIGASFDLAMRDAVISGLAISPEVTNGTTDSNQMPVASTKISAPSNNRPVPQSILNVDSTAGFPATCDTGGCLLTVGLTVADGPSQNAIVQQAFTYTGTTPTSFTGLAPASPVPASTYVLRTGSTVALDVVPSGFIALNATATASLPGWVVDAAQACVVYATDAVPGPTDNVGATCDAATGNAKVDLATNGPGALVAVNGFLPPPTLPDGVTNAGKFWVVVRAQEGPDGTPCTAPDACRWSPWLYYDPITTHTTTTRPLAEDNIPVVSTAGFPTHGQLTAVTTDNQPVTVNYYGTNPTTFLTNNGGGVPGTLAAGAAVTGTAADPATFRTLTLVVAGPTTSNAVVTPSPNDGFLAGAGNLGLVDSFDVQATVSSPYADIALAEVFVARSSRPNGAAIAAPQRCTVPPNTPAGCVVFGQGAEMTSADGLWNHAHSTSVTAFVPLSELQGLTDGLVAVWVHGKDAAGNWGPFQRVDLVLDRTAPVTDSVTNTAAPASTTTTGPASLPTDTLAVTSTAGFPAGGSVEVATSTGTQVLTYSGTTATSLTGVTGGTAAAVDTGATVTAFTGTVTVAAHDTYSTALNPPDPTGTNGVSSGVVGAEWYVGTDPGPGNGTKPVTTPATLPNTPNTAAVTTFQITGLPAGTEVHVRVMDAAGNWSAPVAVTL